MKINQIKSKNRVVDHGEVLTPSWLVNKMLNLIPSESTKISSRYLENSCGEGAFLVEVLRRKLDLIFNTYKDVRDLKFYTVIGLSNIYGLELLKDNIEISKIRLRDLVQIYFENRLGQELEEQFLKVVDYMLNINIININALTYEIPSYENNELLRDKNGDIIYSGELGRISEWQIDYDKRKIKRVEYYYKDIVKEQEDHFNYLKSFKTSDPLQLSLFEDDLNSHDLFDPSTYITEARPVHIYQNISYINLNNAVIIERGGIK